MSIMNILLSVEIRKTVWVRYAVALTATLVALLVCRALNPPMGDYAPYMLAASAIAFSAWYCGVGPSLSAIILAAIGVKYWFVPPIHMLRIQNSGQWIDLLGFLFFSSVVVVMGEARRRQEEQLRSAQGRLEVQVQERTAELAAANQGLRELSARLLQLQDDERRRIARELHDSVGQTLVALSMNLSAARADIEQLTKAAITLSDSEALVRNMSDEVRTISHLLHPPLLDEAGLASAVRWYVDGFAQRSKIEVHLDLPDHFARLERESETAIFRIVQECLTNVHRHSGSSVAKIRLRHSDGQVLVAVEDKGKGIPQGKQNGMDSSGSPGVGIRGMRERLRQLGGNLEIESTGSGTVIIARLPVKETSSSEDTFSIPGTSRAVA